MLLSYFARFAQSERSQFNSKRGGDGLDSCELWYAARIAGSWRTATRDIPGMSSLSNSNHFALMPNSADVNPVALPPGRAKLSTNPPATGSVTATNTIGSVRVACCKASTVGFGICEYYVWRKRGNFHCVFSDADQHQVPSGIRTAHCPRSPSQNPANPAGTLRPLLAFRNRLPPSSQSTPMRRNSARLLPARCKRPCRHRSAEQRDELPPSHHSMTSSARASSDAGMSRPSATPVIFPPGQLRLATSPICTGSPMVVKMMGVCRVAAFAATAAGVVRRRSQRHRDELARLLTLAGDRIDPLPTDIQLSLSGPRRLRFRSILGEKQP